ncbi:MAG TPA: PAS domain S-box protein, partial [Bacteroidota bacterium]|nr:PAS domain S-box protein [Bacteroidota bacterium]
TLRGLRLLLHKLRESVTVVYRFRHQDGSWRWMEGVGTNMLDEESVRAIVVNTRDITERKTEEEKLSRSESHLRRAQSVGKTGSWYVDLEKNTLEWSQEVYRIFGRNPWTFPATNEDFFASVHPEDREAVLAAFAESIRTGKRFEIEHRIILTDGSERIVFEQGEVTRDDRGKSVAMIGVVQDISERRRAEEELLRSAAIIASSDDAIFTKTLDGIIVSWNPGAEKIYGYSAAEIRGRPVSILAPLDRQDELPAIMTKLRKGERMDHYETVRITKEGKCIDVSLSISPLKDSQGKIVGAASIARDITERNIIVGEIRKLNEELERRVMQRTAQLEAANKELESFSYSVSHDLRAPLRAIVGFGKVLMEEHSRDLNADGQRLMKVMIDNGNRMGELIDDLLAFSRFRRQHLVLSNVDLNQIARDVFEEVAAGNKERSIRLDLRYLLPACGDPALIRQVLQNLISNAVKFTSRRDEAVVEIGCSETGREVTYYVKDNGIGFDMRYVDRLFGVFQRLHSMEEFEGTGVGLAIVKRIVERHGGRVWADARLNEGATIFFTLTNSEQIPLCSDEP